MAVSLAIITTTAYRSSLKRRLVCCTFILRGSPQPTDALRYMWEIAVVLVAFLHFAPNLLDINPQPVTVELVKSFDGPYAPNELLSKSERLFEGVLEGPESLALHKGHIYTGLRTGEIVKIYGDKYSKVAQIGKGDPKDGVWTEKQRGRTLGLRFSKKGKLLAADAYYGLYEVDVDTGETKALLPTSKAVAGKHMMFPDDVSEDEKTGLIFMSDASTRWGLDDIVPLCIENEDTGRIIQYDPKTGSSSVFADGLRFPNGVQVTHDGKYLLVAEINGHVVWKYHLSGKQKGEREVFARFPGEPDNIRKSPRGGYWVALVSARNASRPTLSDKMANFLTLKRILTRLSYGLGVLLDMLTSLYPSAALKDLAYRIQKLEFMFPMAVNYCMVVELDGSGQVVRTLQSSDKRLCYISEVLEHDGYLYMGSFINPYLVRLKL